MRQSLSPDISQGLWISVDLEGLQGSGIIGYRAKIHSPLIDLDKVNFYDPADFWEAIPRPRGGYITLNPGEFYILASKERIKVPPKLSAEMVAYDPSVGEFPDPLRGFL